MSEALILLKTPEKTIRQLPKFAAAFVLYNRNDFEANPDQNPLEIGTEFGFAVWKNKPNEIRRIRTAIRYLTISSNFFGTAIVFMYKIGHCFGITPPRNQ